ncbi:hypothetical protein HPB48_001525 [Haemaphysalis longicornis]|uniref:CCAAT-binding factor domain-containing protein n=1 Tax=Haemaphysalis longicornis TaxID=44386 RepID=A0A9J6GZ30_HAELO|nr:hypothetical protein HPB48_001525 [Haemaphysalis longicornis]
MMMTMATCLALMVLYSLHRKERLTFLPFPCAQLLLSDDEAALARSLVSFYFGFFKKCVQRSSRQADARTMKVLLTGVNRAFPYARSADSEGLPEDQVDLMFRLVHLTDFNIAVQALTLLFQILDAKSSLSDRFYGALYRKALDPALEHSSHQTMFLNLLYRSLKRDAENNRVKAFLKRLLQVCLYRSPHLACGILFLVSEVVKLRPVLLDDTRTFDEAPDEEEAAENKPQSFEGDEESDGGEHYEDIPDESDEEGNVVAEKRAQSDGGAKRYDPLARNPLYCGAEHCAIWELRHLCHHHHPSVALFAERILRRQPVAYPGDPLQDFTLARFLDRYFKQERDRRKAEKSRRRRRKATMRSCPMRRVWRATMLNECSTCSSQASMGNSTLPPPSREARSARRAVPWIRTIREEKRRDSEDDEDDLEGLDDDEEYQEALSSVGATKDKGAAIREEDIEFSDDGAKQLRWERDRDAWVRGQDWRSRKRKFGGGGGGSMQKRGKMPGKRQKRR